MSTHTPPNPHNLHTLPRSLQPDTDLWPGIAARLSPRRANRRWPLPLALAASLAISLLAGRALLAPPAKSSALTAPPPVALALAPAQPLAVQPPAAQPLTVASYDTGPEAPPSPLPPPRFTTLREEVSRIALANASQMGADRYQQVTYNRNPERSSDHALVLKNLRVLQQAETSVRTALAADPHSPELQQQLRSLTRQRQQLRQWLAYNAR